MKQDRNSRLYTYQGESLTLSEIARRLGIRAGTLWARLQRMEPERAFSLPLRPWRHQ